MSFNSSSEHELRQEGQYKNAYHWNIANLHQASIYNSISLQIVDLILKAQSLHPASPSEIDIFDLGCGDGKSTFDIARELSKTSLVNSRIFGHDYSQSAISHANRQVSQYSDLSSSFELFFDVYSLLDSSTVLSNSSRPKIVILREVIEHIEESTLNQFAHNLSKIKDLIGIIITVPSINSPTAKKHLRHYSPAALRKYLDNFSNLKATVLYGFYYRPKFLYYPLVLLKNTFGDIPFVAKIMNFTLCRKCDPKSAQTLLSLKH